MAERTRRQARTQEASFESEIEDFSSISDAEIEAYLLEQTVEEELAKAGEETPSVWNLATLAGLGLTAIGSAYVLNLLGILTGGIGALAMPAALVGAILALLLGLGVLSRSPSRKLKKARQRAAKLRLKARREAEKQRSIGRRSRKAAQTASKAADLAVAGAAQAASKAKQTLAARRGGWKRSRTDKKVSGVAGGIAKALGVQSGFVRAAFVVLSFLTSPAITIPLYILLTFVLPEEESSEPGALAEGERRVRVVR